jgi:glycosyltransferase involved in cell wall biosynthesis
MRILFLSDLLAYGGASKLIYDLLPRMVQQGNECELLILTKNHSKYIKDLRKQGVLVNIVPKEIKGPWAKIQYIKCWIEKGCYDVIHANLFPITYYCSIIKRILGNKCPPLVMTEHSTDNRRRHKAYLRPLEKFIYKKYDHVISISDKTQENLCKWLNTEGNKRFSVIENGIDVETFRAAKQLEKKVVCENYEEGDILLLTVGSFTPQKNHEKLLEAVALLPPNYKLLLCGEGPLETEIKGKVEKLRLGDRVVFLGFRKDVARIMHTADILVIPSIWEGFGLIAVEGMACGIPIAASDVPGLSEVVGNAGVKFDSKDADSIAEIVKGLRNNSNQYVVLGNKRAEKYNIQKTTSLYVGIYKNLIGVR